MKRALSLILVFVLFLSLCACGNESTEPTTASTGSTTTTSTEDGIVTFTGDYVWKSAVSIMPLNWNPHTYQTADDAVPLEYITSPLYAFFYNDALNPVEGVDPYAGYVIVPEMAAAMPEDVTAAIKSSNPEFKIPEAAEAGYAYKIKLNENATWDDGTKITAETYVESFKRLLDPKLLNYRASDWYGGALSIVGAENYLNQGTAKYIDDASLVLADLVKGADGNYVDAKGQKVFIAVGMGLDLLYGHTLVEYVKAYKDKYFSMTYWETLSGAADSKGLVPANDETLAQLSDLVTSNANWGDTDEDLPTYLVYETFPYPKTFEWSNVGILATGEYELTVVLDKPLEGFDLLYNLADLTAPLVKADLYDACLKSETNADGIEVWTSTYNTNLETTPSFGPYKMSEWWEIWGMHFVRNDNWFGYTDGKHVYVDPSDGKTYPMYQTTEVDVQVVKEAATRHMMFLRGQLISYGLEAGDFAKMYQSEYCYATPGASIFFMILSGHKDAIAQRESAESFDKAAQDLQMLTNTAFHRALALAYDKGQFAAANSAGAGVLGMIGNGLICDADTGAQYRDSDQAKKVLCDFYGVDTAKFANLDEAVASITGCNSVLAKDALKQAFKEGIEAGYINDADNDGKCDQVITIEYAVAEDSDIVTQTVDYLNKQIAEVTKDTPFDGKIRFVKAAPGKDWSTKIREGLADAALVELTGSVMNPFALTDLFTNSAKQYDAAWYDVNKIELTINVPVSGANKDVTLTLKQWSDALNGTPVEVAGVTYNYSADQADLDVRLDILAACEGKLLEAGNCLPMVQSGSVALLSQQVYYVVEDYNPLLGRGGLAYTKYHYDEYDWSVYVQTQGGMLKY